MNGRTVNISGIRIEMVNEKGKAHVSLKNGDQSIFEGIIRGPGTNENLSDEVAQIRERLAQNNKLPAYNQIRKEIAKFRREIKKPI